MTDQSVKSARAGGRGASRPSAQLRLLEAATQVFGQRGYHGARVSDIVGSAGLAQGTFYLYFKSKEAIFLRLVDDFLGELLGATLGRHPADRLQEGGALVEQLHEMWVTILERCRAQPVLAALVLRESQALGPASREHVDQRFATLVGVMSSYLQELIARGVLPAPEGTAGEAERWSERAAWTLLGLIERAVYYAVVVDPDADVEALAETFLRLELGGLMAAGDPLLKPTPKGGGRPARTTPGRTPGTTPGRRKDKETAR